VVLIGVSPRLSHGAHFLMHLLVTCVSSLERCCFSSFEEFFLIGFCVLLLYCLNSLHILDISSFLGGRFANIFLHFVNYLLCRIFFKVSSQLICIGILGLSIGVHFHIISLVPYNTMEFLSLCFPVVVL
jgi:hypothetical protein